MMYAVI